MNKALCDSLLDSSEEDRSGGQHYELIVRHVENAAGRIGITEIVRHLKCGWELGPPDLEHL
jgi:hypothetical protein